MAPANNIPVLLGTIASLVAVAAIAAVGSFLAVRCRRPQHAYIFAIAAVSASWWVVSLSLTLTDRLFLGRATSKIPFTLSITQAHTVLKCLLSLVVLAVTRRPAGGAHAGDVALALVAPRSHASGWHVWYCLPMGVTNIVGVFHNQRLSTRVLLLFIIPLGVCTGMDVWLSKVALQSLEVNTYTVVKSSAVVFTLAFSLALRLQQFSWRMLAIVVGIFVGVSLSMLKPQRASAAGVIATLVASACSAGRWTITQRYFARPGIEPNVFALIVLQGPAAFITLSPMWVVEVVELPAWLASADSADVSVLAGMALGGGVLAFLLILLELQLVHMTSALTMNVVGHLKDVIAIGLALVVFHEYFSSVNAMGTALTLTSIASYAYIKAQHLRISNAHREHRPTPTHARNGEGQATGGSVPSAIEEQGEEEEESGGGRAGQVPFSLSHLGDDSHSHGSDGPSLELAALVQRSSPPHGKG